MSLRQWTVDAFAAAPFLGNPACVVEPFDRWPDERWMQALAAENNQAETAFLVRTDDSGRFGLRWFTPTLEAPLCGHATLAAAHVLFTELGVSVKALTFETQRAGELFVERRPPGYLMDFPADPPRKIDAPPGLADALGATPVEVWSAQYLVAVFADEASVRAMTPDLGLLARVEGDRPASRGNVAVAARADVGREYDVVDRFFAPGSGIPEDPTTGSLHCILAPLYAAKFGREDLRFHQAYPGRGGDLVCRVKGARVELAGEAVTVIESRLRHSPMIDCVDRSRPHGV